MIIQQKAIKLQRAIFGLLVIFGIFAIAKVYFTQTWFLFTVLGLAVVFMIVSYIMYKRSSNDVVIPITQKQLKANKYILYSYVAVYIAYVLLEGANLLSAKVSGWIFAPLLVIIAIAGVILQQMTLNNKK